VTTVTETKPSWTEDAAASPSVPEDKILQELEDLALGEDDVTARAATLFNFLRKITDKDRAISYLTGIQLLIRRGEPAGARLLASFLDVSTPGDRLLPLVQRFTSSRRLRFHILSGADDPGTMHQSWLNRSARHPGNARRSPRASGLLLGGGPRSHGVAPAGGS